MPTVREKKAWERNHASLVGGLYEAMRAGAAKGQPLVFVNRIGTSGALNVTVVWQAWSDLGHQARSDIIMDAYRRMGAEKIPIALGVTFEEAISSGLLPFSIVPLVRESDPISPDRIRTALLQEGAVETSGGLLLRFADSRQAQEAYRRLVQSAPGPYWSIVHEIKTVTSVAGAMSPPNEELNEELVVKLAEFLFQPPLKGQPFIIRKSIGTTGLQNLIVIWDRWHGVPLQERTEIILAANDTLETTMRANLSLALGRTMDEAISLGYLPFRVEPISRSGSSADRDRILNALREEGAVETGQGLQLRFPTLEQAQDAFIELEQKVSGPYWSIVHKVPCSD